MKSIAIVSESLMRCHIYFEECFIEQLGYKLKDVKRFGKGYRVGDYFIKFISEKQQHKYLHGYNFDKCYVVGCVDNSFISLLKSMLVRSGGQLIMC